MRSNRGQNDVDFRLQFATYVKSAFVAALAAASTLAYGAQNRGRVQVGSKAFTESVILGELLTQTLAGAGTPAEHRRQLGGTKILWAALLSGEIDVYPEYTGTIAQELFSGAGLRGDEAIRQALAARGVKMTASLGFNNTYAIGMRAEVAERLGIVRISDLTSHPELKIGFSNEFTDRNDGWPLLRDRYGLPQRDVRGIDHDLAYRALESGAIQVMDLYSTDAEIRVQRRGAVSRGLGAQVAAGGRRAFAPGGANQRR